MTEPCIIYLGLVRPSILSFYVRRALAHLVSVVMYSVQQKRKHHLQQNPTTDLDDVASHILTLLKNGRRRGPHPPTVQYDLSLPGLFCGP